MRAANAVRDFPGGLDAYQRQLPNETYCADGQLCRVGFMAEGDAMAHARHLVSAGLQGPVDGPSPAFAIASAAAGHLIPCDWLELHVDDTGHTEPGPLLLQGLAARLVPRWDVAEQAFRAVTTLQPTLLSAWYHLTWALASLGRLDEAESIARHALAMAPDDPASLRNLAAVLRERGNLDEALSVITRAVELQPEDHISEVILDRIRNDRRKQISRRNPR